MPGDVGTDQGIFIAEGSEFEGDGVIEGLDMAFSIRLRVGWDDRKSTPDLIEIGRKTARVSRFCDRKWVTPSPA